VPGRLCAPLFHARHIVAPGAFGRPGALANCLAVIPRPEHRLRGLPGEIFRKRVDFVCDGLQAAKVVLRQEGLNACILLSFTHVL